VNCPRCQAQNRQGIRFCEECGARLELACPTCGSPAIPGKRFCGNCGAPLAGETGGRIQTPHAYTPKHLAEKILTSKAALEGERKQVTVLFADLKGSMELLAERDPEEGRKLLDPVLERMMEAVHRYEGTVNQVMGDGIMALFGAPLAHEDHAVRACYAALRMLDSVSRYGDELQRSYGVPVQIRVGINSGEVVVRSIGGDLHMDYTAVGQTTHLAARLEQMAKPGSGLIAAPTLRLAEGYVQVTSIGPVPVKGLEAPVEVYQLVGAGPVRSRLQAAAARGLTRFVGRDAEMDALARALERGLAGHGQIVGVVGEPGVGKSRLFYEFTHSHRVGGCLILETASMSYGKATAYLPILDLLKRYFKIDDRDDSRTLREKVTGKILTLDPALEDTIPPVLALLEALPADHPFLSVDPPKRRQQTLDGLKRILLRESQAEPVVLVFEDLHWLDTETQALLDSLVESLPTARLVLLVNYRPEYQHLWSSKTYYTQLRIDPLAAESAEALLEALLGDDASLGALKRLLIERTEGNPFFLEESVWTLAETRTLEGKRGVYRLAQPLLAVQVPATVQSILAARIDRLPPDEKRLLQSASVIGKDVPLALLAAVAEGSEEELRQGLAHLQAAEFVYETRLFPDLEYTFKHALTHEVAYQSLLGDRRRALHARISEAIERQYGDRLGEHVELLAHHTQRGEAWDRAHVYLRQAGAKAMARSAYREAAAHFEEALAALQRLPESRATNELAIDLRFDLRNPLHVLGELGKLLDHLHEAEALAQRLDDPRRLGRTLSYLSQYCWLTGKNAKAIEAGGRALDLAGAVGDPMLGATTDLYLGMAYEAIGDFRRAIEALQRTVDSMGDESTADRPGHVPLLIHATTWLAVCLAELGEFPRAFAHAERVVRIAEAADRSFDLVTAYFGLAFPLLHQGNYLRAISILERTLAMVESGGFETWRGTIMSSLGHAYTLSGRLTEALPLLEHAASLKVGYYRPRWGYLAEAYTMAGRIAEAKQPAERFFKRAREGGARAQEAWALRLLGHMALHRQPPDSAEGERRYGEALALAEELGLRPLLSRCHLELGRLYAATGRSEARSHLSTAAALLRQMDMHPWLEEAETKLRVFGS